MFVIIAMVTVVNNPGPREDVSGDTASGVIVGVIVVVLLALVVYFMIWGLPAFNSSRAVRSSTPASSGSTNINVTVPPVVPDTHTSSNSNTGN